MEPINLKSEIEMHQHGVGRLEASESPWPPAIETKETLELSDEITKLCRDKGLTYNETLKAIIHADNSLYYRTKVRSSDAQ